MLDTLSDFSFEYGSEIAYIRKTAPGGNLFLRKIVCFQKRFCVLDPQGVKVFFGRRTVYPVKFTPVVGRRNADLLRQSFNG